MGEKVIISKYKLHKCKLPQSNNTIQKICYYSRHKKDIHYKQHKWGINSNVFRTETNMQDGILYKNCPPLKTVNCFYKKLQPRLQYGF